MKEHWKRQVLMFYPLEKNSEKNLRGGGVGIQIAQPLKNKTVRAEVDLTNKTYIDNNTNINSQINNLLISSDYSAHAWKNMQS